MKASHALLIAALLEVACGKQPGPAGPAVSAAQDPTKADPAGAGSARTSPPPPAADGSMTVDEAGAQLTALLDKIGAAVTSAGDDCAKMGASLKLLTGEVKRLMASGKSIDSDPAKRREFDSKFGDRLMKQMESWMPGAQKCNDDPEVKAFFATMS